MSQNLLALKIGRVSDVLHARARPIGIGYAICPGLPWQLGLKASAEVSTETLDQLFNQALNTE